MTTPRGHWFSGFVLAFVVFLTISTHLASGQVDLTIQPRANGKEVVEATLARFESFSTVDKLSNFNEFLRRVAYVVTDFGVDGDTFRDGYDGGIWQIDENNFNLTKSSPLADVLNLRTEIERRFQIVWIEVPWVNLRKPLYSALAARLLISTFPTRPPNNAQIAGQAGYWKLHYDTQSGLGTEEGFIDGVNELLDSERCFVSRLDLVFVVDGSGSVTQANFDTSKDFVKQIVDSFEIGPDRVRVGFIQYASSPTVEFRLNDYMDKGTLLSAIDTIMYGGGGTNTGAAINAMVSELFGEGKGARNVEDNIPRLGIIMTDGQSGNVLGPADNARAQDITLFAIGIGTGIVLEELQEIANDPDEKYVFEVNNFDVVTNIQSLVSREACEDPIGVGLGIPSLQRLPAMTRIFVEFSLPPSNMMTVTLNATMGEISAYFSTEVTNPNPAFHQWSAHASEENPVAQVFINATKEDPSRQKRQAEQQQVYGTIINTFNVSTSDMSGVNGTDVNATSAVIPETVFTLVTEEGDTRIVIPTTSSYATSRNSTPVIPTTSTYTTNRITTPGDINTTTMGYTSSSSVAAENASTGYTTSTSVAPENPNTGYTTSTSVAPENPNTGDTTSTSVAPENPNTGYTTSTSVALENPTTGYTTSIYVAPENPNTGYKTSTSVASENPTTGYTTSTSVAPENPMTGYTTSTSVAPENPNTGYTTSTSVAPEHPITGYTTSTSVAPENPTPGYKTSTSVAPENPITGHTTSTSVAPENASEEIIDISVTENIRAPNHSRLTAGGVAGIIIVIFILLILIVVIVAVYLIKRRNTEVKPDEEATDMAQMSSTKADANTEPDSMRYETAKVNQGDIGQTDSETVDETQKVVKETPPTEVPTGKTQNNESDTDPEVDVGTPSDSAYDDKVPHTDGEDGTKEPNDLEAVAPHDPEAEKLVYDAKATEEGNKNNSETNAAFDEE